MASAAEEAGLGGVGSLVMLRDGCLESHGLEAGQPPPSRPSMEWREPPPGHRRHDASSQR